MQFKKSLLGGHLKDVNKSLCYSHNNFCLCLRDPCSRNKLHGMLRGLSISQYIFRITIKNKHYVL